MASVEREAFEKVITILRRFDNDFFQIWLETDLTR